MKYSIFFLLAIRCEKKKTLGSGRVRALNLTVPLGSGRVGSDDLGYGPGLGFSLKPVQTSSARVPTRAGEACSMEKAGQICRRSLTGWITLVIN